MIDAGREASRLRLPWHQGVDILGVPLAEVTFS